MPQIWSYGSKWNLDELHLWTGEMELSLVTHSKSQFQMSLSFWVIFLYFLYFLNFSDQLYKNFYKNFGLLRYKKIYFASTYDDSCGQFLSLEDGQGKDGR